MLTKNEENWLNGRKVLCPRCDCFRAHIEGTGTCHRGEKSGWMQVECRFFYRSDVFKVNFEDAAKFEAAVHKHLMYQYERVVQYAEITGSFCPNRSTMMMFARLDAEKEMPI